ncbi:small integral membrane protein 8 [Lingula anatina]|uniref:Small integral membrane protein 8 n=1 Tax=Lingula anatina TaxID=7574 RepID=A0A1S3J3K3_LINAN|nr:small integral membrane protein 8 [Lingula anatina]|eukprot:XP_013404838.1 small integral membrane protein 8 [Lingula anatina]
MAEKGSNGNTPKPPPATEGYQEPGWKNIKTTSVFRAVNFELFVKPNKVVMGLGLVAISGCVAYLAYMNAMAENKADMYRAVTEDGEERLQKKTSKWD